MSNKPYDKVHFCQGELCKGLIYPVQFMEHPRTCLLKPNTWPGKAALPMDLTQFIRTVPDFPAKGINFRDITPLLANPKAFKYASLLQIEKVIANQFDVVVGIESRGFIFGSVIANTFSTGFVPARKPGKLPTTTISRKYGLEYRKDELFMHSDAILPGQKALVVDDLLATGGSAVATVELIRELGGEVVTCLFFIELDGLPGRAKLEAAGLRVESVLHFPA